MATPDHSGTPPPSPGEAARRRSVVVAGHRGDLDTVRAHLRDTAGAVRASALGALARSGALEPADLVPALGDDEPAVRRRAAREAAALPDEPGPPGVVTALVALLDDDDPSVTEVAAFALGEVSPGGATADVVAALGRTATDHPDALCREAAVAALGSLGDPAGIDSVLAACEDRATVRRRAVLALAAFEDERVTEQWRRLASDRDIQVRQAAEDLLAIEEGEAT